MMLREVALTRSGDKGDTSNICVFPYDDSDYEWLCERVTVEAVAALFGELVKGTVTRYEWPGLKGLNFVLTEALRGGVSNSLLVDPHCKCYQSLLLTLDVGDRPA